MQPVWIDSHILTVLVLIAGGLLVAQAVFTFLLWRKGDDSYLPKFIALSIAAFVVLMMGIGWLVMMEGDPSSAFVYTLAGIFLFVAPIAIGIQIFIFIRDTWFPKDDEGPAKKPSKKKGGAA